MLFAVSFTKLSARMATRPHIHAWRVACRARTLNMGMLDAMFGAYCCETVVGCVCSGQIVSTQFRVFQDVRHPLGFYVHLWRLAGMDPAYQVAPSVRLSTKPATKRYPLILYCRNSVLGPATFSCQLPCSAPHHVQNSLSPSCQAPVFVKKW